MHLPKMNSKKRNQILKYSFFAIVVFIAASMLVNSQIDKQHPEVLLYAGTDKVIMRLVTFLFIAYPIILANWATMVSKKHWLFKTLFALVATPVLGIVFFIISTQTTKTFINLYVTANPSEAVKVSEKLVVIDTYTTVNHGKHYTVHVKKEDVGSISYRVTEAQYNKLNINDSLKVTYYITKQGSIYR